MTDKSLDLVSELCHGGNREWYDGNDNINTINDKIDLVMETSEVIDSFMTDAYSIIDAINKSHNNDSLYDTLAEDLKKCKDTILKMINSSNICVKQNTKENDTDNINVCEKQDTNKKEASINENYDDNDCEADDDDHDSEADDDSETDDDSVNTDFSNLSDETINNLNSIDKIRKEILNNNSEIRELISEVEYMSRHDFLFKLYKFKKLNKLSDNLLDHIWKIAYGENKVNNEINSIDIDKKKKDAKGYTNKYINIVYDKICLINNVLELTDELMEDIDKNTYNDIAISKTKVFKNNSIKRIEKCNLYIKHEIEKKYTENNIESDTENNTKPDTENNIEPVTKIVDKKKNTKPDTKLDKDLATSDEIKKHIIDKQKIIKKKI